jgi:transposase
MHKFYVGGDASKGYSDFTILDAQMATVEEPFRLDDTPAGHSKLVSLLQGLLRDHPGSEVYVGFESTGGFENNWLATCEQVAATLAVKSARINPKPVRKHLHARMKRTVTDKVSAENIAEYMIRYPQNVLYDQDDPFYSMRRQWTYFRLLQKQETQARNQLHGLLYGAHPDLVRFCRNGIGEWALQLLSRYPTAAQLARARAASVARIPYITLEKAQGLVEAAKTSVGALQDDVTAMTIQQLVDQIRFLTRSVESVKKRMEQACNHPAVNLLCTFQGIGKHSAIGLMINIRDHNLYPEPKHLASFFGLHPVFRQSGDGTWGMHMSKEGRSEPRHVLFMVAWAAKRYNPHIRELYEQRLKEGMKPMAALGVCMHKILRIIYGMLRTNTAYDPEIDRTYRRRHKRAPNNRPTQKTVDRALRFQPHDDTAPISRRQTRRRKGANGSQSRLATECGITVAPSSDEYTNPVTRKVLLTEMSKSNT